MRRGRPIGPGGKGPFVSRTPATVPAPPPPSAPPPSAAVPGTVLDPSPTATIWIVDDHQLVASSLAGSLRAAGYRALCHPIRSAPDILAATMRSGAGLVLLDLELGRDGAGHRIDGVALVGPLRAAGRHVLALTDNTAPEEIGAALSAGAAGAIPKNAPFATLLTAVHGALTGRPVNSPAQRRHLIEQHERHQRAHHHLHDALAALTAREREVLELLAAGQRARTIAAHYVVSVATVRTQIRAVLTKMGVNSQLEAVALYSRYARPGR